LPLTGASPPIPAYRRSREHKGVVERDIGYTKHNALDGRVFENLEDANVFLRHWNKRWARTRIHGTTKCQVWKLFCEVEQARLRPLQEKTFEFFRVSQRKVDVNGLVEVDVCYYGVPPKYVGEKVIVHHNQEWVKIYSGEELVITHRSLKGRGKVSQPLACYPAWKHPDLESQERYYCRKAREIGPDMHKLVYQSLCKDDPLAIRRVRGFLSLGRTYGAALAEHAATSVLAMRRGGYHTVRALCEQLKNAPDKEQSSAAALTQHHELIRPLSEYDAIINHERNTL
jgi:hypothetical protein